MDGVDAVVVEISKDELHTLGGLTHRYPPSLSTALHAAIATDARLSLHELASLDIEVGECFAAAARTLITSLGALRAPLVAVGSHGQTLRHAPRAARPYSVQIGSAATIAARLGLTTVADFRALDIAYGGEGAPLVPAFHEWLLRDATENRVIANLGGIANLTVLPATAALPIAGYDTGPGNCLLDSWCMRNQGLGYDEDGRWAANGKVMPGLLEALLSDSYYSMPPPKSTGREVFNVVYLEALLAQGRFANLAPHDVQATLAELTVESLARAIERHGKNWAARLFVCGGGSHNGYLMQRLAARLAPMTVTATTTLGLDPDLVEASAFAWLAYMRINERPVRMTTGPQIRALKLGAIYPASPALTS